MNTNN